MLSAAEFKRQFFDESNDLRRIKLSIREEHFSIWTRTNPSNLGPEFLAPILELPDDYPTRRAPRKSGEPGDMDVIILQYEYREFGSVLPIYLKGYFKYDGGLDVEFDIQSLKKDTPLRIVKGGNLK